MSLEMTFNECLSPKWTCLCVAGMGQPRCLEKFGSQPGITSPSLQPKDPCHSPSIPPLSRALLWKRLQPFSLSVLCLLLPLLRWVRWRCDRLSREELREKMIWIDKNYNRWKIYCFAKNSPFLSSNSPQAVLSVDCSTPRVWNTRSSPLKMLEGVS